MNGIIPLRDAALALLGGAPTILNAGPPPAAAPPALPAALAAALADLRAAAVSADGARVDYAALRGSPAYAAYRAVAAALPALAPAELADPAVAAAFWINLYNGLVIDGVVQLGVRRSVAERGAGVGFFRRAAYRVAGLPFSLDDIEHGVLRANAGNPLLPGPQFAPGDPRLALALATLDPRVHFALNCASRSCPPIAVYRAERLAAQLDLAARSFVAAETVVDPARGLVELSAIFEWYQADFGGLEGALRFVIAHLSDGAPRRWLLAQPAVDVAFRPYDWGLNAS